jgi:hypothetical protein
VGPLGRAAAALLPWRLHRADSDEAEQYFAVAAADGAGLAGAHRRVKAAAAESPELGLSQEGVNAIGPEEKCTEMNSKQLPGIVLNGWWNAARGIRSTWLYCESEVERGCARAAKAMKIEVEVGVASEEG